MQSPWPVLRAQLIRSTETLIFNQRFQALRKAEPTLGRFSDPPALFDALHGPDGEPEVRNDILRALVRQGQAEPEPATTLLLVALWPGVDAVYRRLARHFRGEPQSLVSEIASRTVAGIQGMDLTRVNRVAGSLIRNVERDIIRSLQKTAARRRVNVGENELSSPAGRSWLGIPPDLEPEEAVARLTDWLRPIISRDATLVVAIAVRGERQRDAAAALGLHHDAGRKRYRRALQRLQVVLDKIA